VVTITSAELQRHLGRYRELAKAEPIWVQHYGRDSLVVISAEEYRRLKSLDVPETFVSISLSGEAIEKLERTLEPVKRED
jgi:PHD/YefM family antitoxin component YafN of YafNO toxin-antitoxin module